MSRYNVTDLINKSQEELKTITKGAKNGMRTCVGGVAMSNIGKRKPAIINGRISMQPWHRLWKGKY